MRRAARIDQNQPQIVKDLRCLGVTVQPLAAVGEGCPDLLIGFRSRNFLIEIKNPDKPKRDQQLTPDQVEWHAHWAGQVAVCRSTDEILLIIAGEGHER